MSDIGHNRLAELAGLIKAAHLDALQAAQRTAERALEAGRYLLEAKGAVGHGKWSSWLRDNVGFSERTAQRYTQLAKSGLKSATVAEIGIRGAAEMLARGKGVGQGFWAGLTPEQVTVIADAVREGRIVRAAETQEPGVLKRVIDALIDAADERAGDDMAEQLMDALRLTAAGGRWTGPRDLPPETPIEEQERLAELATISAGLHSLMERSPD